MKLLPWIWPLKLNCNVTGPTTAGLASLWRTSGGVMKIGTAFVFGVVLGSTFLHSLPLGRAATPTVSAKRCPWSAELDAVAAAPKNHKVLLENDHVRVLDVTVAPGEREAVHAHCLPSVMYVMYEGIDRNYDAQGRLINEQKVAPPLSTFPQVYWLESTPPHAVQNLDAQPIRLLRVELKQ
jgi:hypothetical protein